MCTVPPVRFEVYDSQLLLFSISTLFLHKGLRTESHVPEAVKEPFVREQRQ